MTKPTETTFTDSQIGERAREIVAQNVLYCVSHLVSELGELASKADDSEILEAIYKLASRDADSDDYSDADSDGVKVTGNDSDGWSWSNDDNEESDAFDTELEAWQDAFETTRQDAPDGSEAFEHWIVTNDLASRLEGQGERIDRDLMGLTVWARCTTGQAIYADYLFERMARADLERWAK